MPLHTGWTADWPIAAGVEYWEYDVFIQLWEAGRERAWANGNKYFPSQNFIREEGTITSITVDEVAGTTTITDTAKTWCTDGVAPIPWFTPCVDTPNPSAPANWDCAVQDLDPVKCFQAEMVSMTSNSVTLNCRASDFVTSGQIPSLASLVGKTFSLFRSGNPNWHLQWPQWANDPHIDFGTIASATATVLTAADAGPWVSGEHITGVSREIIARDSTGKLRRVAITANTDHTLTYATVTFTLSGAFAIVNAGARYLPEQVGALPLCYYTGYTDGFYSHNVDDTLAIAPYPKFDSELYADGPDESDCPDPSTQPILDTDLWSSITNQCGAANDPKNPNVTRSLRWLQAFQEGENQQFSPSGVPIGEDRNDAFNPFVPATWFRAMGNDSNITTTGTVGTFSGQAGIAVGVSAYDFYPVDVFYAILDSAGAQVRQGTGTLLSSTFLAGGFSSPADESKGIVIAPGWHRFFERMIMRMRDCRSWMPGTDPDTGDVVDPPTEAVPGVWSTVAKDTHYCAISQPGKMAQSTLDIDLFADGHIARYVAQNWWDTTSSFQPDIHGDPPYQAFYLDRTFEGLRRPQFQEILDQQLGGTADAGGSTMRLSCAGVNFWIDFYNAGGTALITHSGPDAISGTTVTLTSVAGNGFFTQTPARFPLMVLEGQTGTDAMGNPIWAPRLITAQSTNVLTLNEAMPAASNWRLREPNSITSRLEDLSVTVSQPDLLHPGTLQTATVAVTGNDDHNLFFAALPFTVAAGATFFVDPGPMPGDVIKRTSGAWAIAAGSDAVRRGVATPADFEPDPAANAPDLVKRYGRMAPGDLVPEVMNQLYHGWNAMMDSVSDPSFTAMSSDSDTSPANNSVAADTGTGYWGNCHDCTDPHHVMQMSNACCGTCSSGCDLGSMPATIASSWGSSGSVSAGPPQSFSTLYINSPGDASGCELQASAIACYGVLGVTSYGGLTHSIDWYNWGQIDAADDPPSTVTCPRSGLDLHFASASGQVAYHAWTKWTSTTGSAPTGGGTVNEYTGSKLGSTSIPELPTVTLCAQSDPCLLPWGFGSGGYYVDAQKALIKWNFGFHG